MSETSLDLFADLETDAPLAAGHAGELWREDDGGRPHPGQHRMNRVQLVNWGTFTGYHEVPISERGFLITGSSGSGKSSLLDAISVVLVPGKWLDLNAAARDSAAKGRDRTLLSYVRGAWSRNTDETSGELATKHLRPGPTWSAIGIEYNNAAGVQTTLVRAFWAGRGVNNVDGITKVSMIFDGPFNLRQLEEVVQNGLNLRTVKSRLNPLFASTDFSSFADKFTRRLGISGERALRLLHKTQSTKGLANLDTLLRDFMLDEPRTFEAAERTVEQFVELEDAYHSVQRAERQVECLAPVRELAATRQQALDRSSALTEELESSEAFRTARSIDIHRKEIERLDRSIDDARAAEAAALAGADNVEDELRALRDQHGRAGGYQLELWRREISSLTEQLVKPQRTRHQLAQKLAVLGSVMPETEVQFHALAAEAGNEITAIEAGFHALNDAQLDARVRENEIVGKLNDVNEQLAALARQPSNLDSRDLAVRDAIAQALRISTKRLPFVAELLEVPEEHLEWRGAIERLLGGFSRSVIIPDALYAAASEYINATHLGRKLLYNRVTVRDSDTPVMVGADSVVRKIEVAQTDVSGWLHTELSRRFDYVCAESIDRFRREERAITARGQIKHGRTRHEKDDRRSIDDRRSWVLGFDNHGKSELFLQDKARLTCELDEAKRSVDDVAATQRTSQLRLEACQYIRTLHWDDVNADALSLRIHDVQRQIEKYSGTSGELAKLDEQLAALTQEAARVRAEANSASGRLTAARAEHDKRCSGLQEAERERDQLAEVDAGVRERLDARFSTLARAVTLDKLGETISKMVTQISRELEVSRGSANEAEKKLIQIFSAFKAEWPADAADVDTQVHSTGEYLAILERIEYDGLPKFQDRFRELLRTQSNNNLAQLVQLMSQEHKQVRTRIEPVNESLASVDFNPGTHLELRVKDRPLPEVRQFRADVQHVLENALTASAEEASEKYEALHALVTRLGSGASADRAWRDLVLDVRRHVEFQGYEVAHDRSVVEIHTSGEGRSGGQRVKLVTFALAAALRYQLGGQKAITPRYGTVIIDEAFDKADAEFTEVSMRIFEEFGFQMILATPLKMVQTLSEFIGGAAIVSIRNRSESSLRHVEITELAGDA